ncbi:hypothetical protein DL98DRAFT_416897 [Cadophora sp. DSE1049]|nr:hypothetical protein DL98DRAFT_416897 [Cadophora sp. DSE1049]
MARTNAHDRWIDVTNISFFTLSRMSKVEIEWVDCLSLHLELDLLLGKLKLFRFPSICVVMTPSKERGPLNQLFRDALNDWSQPDSHYANEYLKEVISSYRLIFGMDKGSYTAFNQMERMRSRAQTGQADPLLDTLCGQRWDSPEVMCIFDQCDIEDPVPRYKSNSFPFLGTRFLKLQDCTQRNRPESVRQLWHDRRDTSKWWTFWAVIAMGVAALVLGILQVTLPVSKSSIYGLTTCT